MRAQDLPPLPETPGVYLWKRGEEVLYVGKAKSLRARVKSYFHAEGKARRIAEEATGLDFIATRDEVEALLLEANLIKAHRPLYNVLLKDDKHYPFLKLTNEPFPTLLVVRRVEEDGAKYYGPFPEAGALRRIKTLIDRLFPLRKNSGYPMKRRRYPCLNYSMGRCLAPCVGKADPEAYQEVVRQVEAVLEGRVDGLLQELEAKMREAARRLEFERAAEIRDQMEALRAFFSTDQQAFDPEMGDLDFLGMARSGALAVVQLYQVRSGRILGRISRVVEKEEATDEEILWAFLRDHYLEASPLPPLVLLPFPLEDLESLAEPQAQEIRALEVAEEKRRLEELVLRYAPFLDHPRAAALRAEVEALLEADQPALEKLTELEAALKEAEAEAKAARRARLIQLEEALRRLPLPQEAKAPLEEEARRLKEEKARLLEELSALGEAAKPLAEELAHLEGEALAQALPGIRARYAELLKGAGEEARRARLEERKAALRALKEEAEALGLGEEVAEAERALAQGELPDLEALRRRLEEAQALRRRLALEELARLQALAERFRPLGGEAVLKAIEAERQKPLPDPAPIARALQAMKRRLEAKRQELGTRLAAFFRRYAPLEGLKSDTQRRIRPLVEFLRPAQKALDRLGPRGVLEVERALAQAEEALKELEKEKEAADRLLKELGQEDLEALLSSLEAPGGERPDLSPLRLPGVKALGLLDDPLPLPRPQLKALHQALKALEAATGEALGPALVRLGGSYLVLAPWRGHEAVALVEPEALDPFLKALSG